MKTILVRLRVEMWRAATLAEVLEQVPVVFEACVQLTEGMLAMKMPREVAARLLLGRTFEDVLTKVAENVGENRPEADGA